MMLDQLLTFARLASLALATGTTKIGKEVYLGPEKQRVALGNNAFFEAFLAEDVTSGGAGTLQIQFVSADDAALTTNVVVLAQSAVLALADLKKGKRLLVTGLPWEPQNIGPYLGVRAVVGTAAITAGKLNAHIAQAPRAWFPYEANTGGAL